MHEPGSESGEDDREGAHGYQDQVLVIIEYIYNSWKIEWIEIFEFYNVIISMCIIFNTLI